MLSARPHTWINQTRIRQGNLIFVSADQVGRGHGRSEHGCQVGSVLERARLRMKEWGHEENPSSVALQVEAVILTVLWVSAVVAAVTTLLGPTEADAHCARLAADAHHEDRYSGCGHRHRRMVAGQAKLLERHDSAHDPVSTTGVPVRRLFIAVEQITVGNPAIMATKRPASSSSSIKSRAHHPAGDPDPVSPLMARTLFRKDLSG